MRIGGRKCKMREDKAVRAAGNVIRIGQPAG